MYITQACILKSLTKLPRQVSIQYLMQPYIQSTCTYTHAHTHDDDVTGKVAPIIKHLGNVRSNSGLCSNRVVSDLEVTNAP